jgi:F420-non-reducing hydrogenase iron-sulfur subunit
VAYAKDLLDEVGLGRERLEMVYIGASDAPLWAERVEAFTERIKALGPNPLRELRLKGRQP